jgi:hypothetical protein
MNERTINHARQFAAFVRLGISSNDSLARSGGETIEESGMLNGLLQCE